MGISVIIEDTDITAILELGKKIKKNGTLLSLGIKSIEMIEQDILW